MAFISFLYPFVKFEHRRMMMNDVTNVQGISNPRLVSASTQMFTMPIKPLLPFKPLSDMGKFFLLLICYINICLLYFLFLSDPICYTVKPAVVR